MCHAAVRVGLERSSTRFLARNLASARHPMSSARRVEEVFAPRRTTKRTSPMITSITLTPMENSHKKTRANLAHRIITESTHLFYSPRADSTTIRRAKSPSELVSRRARTLSRRARKRADAEQPPPHTEGDTGERTRWSPRLLPLAVGEIPLIIKDVVEDEPGRPTARRVPWTPARRTRTASSSTTCTWI